VDPTDVPGLFFSSFAGLDNCESLCKKAANYCKNFVKDAAHCEQVSNTGSWFFVTKTSCETIEDPADRKDCKQSVKDARQEGKQFINADKNDALANCDGYRDDCIASCSAP
jgi:hypothetical protein